MHPTVAALLILVAGMATFAVVVGLHLGWTTAVFSALIVIFGVATIVAIVKEIYIKLQCWRQQRHHADVLILYGLSPQS